MAHGVEGSPRKRHVYVAAAGPIVYVILEPLAAGMKPGEITEDYSLEDIRAALLYAARILARRR